MQFWDGRAPTLEAQAAGPPMNPVEMGSTGWKQIVAKLNVDATFRREFEAVYPQGFGEKTITEAIAEFERTLVTPGLQVRQVPHGRRRARRSTRWPSTRTTMLSRRRTPATS